MFGVDVGQFDGNQVVNLKRINSSDCVDELPVKILGGVQCEQVLTISLVTGSLFLSNEVTTSTMASWSFGNLSNSCRHNEY